MEVESSTAADMLLGMELACLAYLDDTQETIEHETPMITNVFGAEAAGKSLTHLLVQRGYIVDKIFGLDEAPGFIAHNDGEIVLGCRGSTGLGDMPANLSTFLVPFCPSQDRPRACTCGAWLFCSCCDSGNIGADSSSALCPCGGRPSRLGDERRVHAGYYGMLLSLLQSLDAILLPQLLDPKPKRLIFTGHSRGGCLACLALAYLLEMPEVARWTHSAFLFLAGAPRCYNDAMRIWFEGKITSSFLPQTLSMRVVNDGDGIPGFPFKSFGYSCPAGKLYHFRSRGALLCDPDEEELTMAQAESSISLEDHQPYNYHAVIFGLAQPSLPCG